MYVQTVCKTWKGKTMALIRSMNVEPEIVNSTQCNMKHACLSGKTVCKVEPYLERDVQLLRCMDDRACTFKKNYKGWHICTCPVNRASFGVNWSITDRERGTCEATPRGGLCHYGRLISPDERGRIDTISSTQAHYLSNGQAKNCRRTCQWAASWYGSYYGTCKHWCEFFATSDVEKSSRHSADLSSLAHNNTLCATRSLAGQDPSEIRGSHEYSAIPGFCPVLGLAPLPPRQPDYIYHRCCLVQPARAQALLDF